MSTLFGIVVVVVVLVCVYLYGKARPNSLVGRMVTLGRVQANKASKVAANTDLAGQLKLAVADMQKALRQRLDKVAGFAEHVGKARRAEARLTDQEGKLVERIKFQKEKIAELTAKAEGLDGDELAQVQDEIQRRTKAGQEKADELLKVRAQLAQATKDRAALESQHEEDQAWIERQRDQIAAKEREAESMGLKLERAAMMTEAAEARAGIGGDTANADRQFDELTERVNATLDVADSKQDMYERLNVDNGDEFDEEFEREHVDAAAKDLFNEI